MKPTAEAQWEAKRLAIRAAEHEIRTATGRPGHAVMQQSNGLWCVWGAKRVVQSQPTIEAARDAAIAKLTK